MRVAVWHGCSMWQGAPVTGWACSNMGGTSDAGDRGLSEEVTLFAGDYRPLTPTKSHRDARTEKTACGKCKVCQSHAKAPMYTEEAKRRHTHCCSVVCPGCLAFILVGSQFRQVSHELRQCQGTSICSTLAQHKLSQTHA
jgi:hypothetical protein